MSSTREIDEYIASVDNKPKMLRSREEVSARNYAKLQKKLAEKGKISADTAETKFKMYAESDSDTQSEMWAEDRDEYREEFDEFDEQSP